MRKARSWTRSQFSPAAKDLELRLEERGFTDVQTRRALMSLLRRGQVSLSGAKRVATRPDGMRA